MSNEVMNNTSPEEEKQYSSFRYAWGAFLAFFGISSATHRASKKRKKLIGDILVYIVMLFGSFLMIYPFWWMIAGSFADTNHPGSLTDILNKLVWWPVLSTADAGYTDPRGLFRNYDPQRSRSRRSSGSAATPCSMSCLRRSWSPAPPS